MSLLRTAERYAAWCAHAILESIAPLPTLTSLDDLEAGYEKLAAQQLADAEAEIEAWEMNEEVGPGGHVDHEFHLSDGEFHEGTFDDPEPNPLDRVIALLEDIRNILLQGPTL